jgi:hypothetical protein
MKQLPKFDDIPEVQGMPKGCTWGIWDKPGQPKDQLGMLNLLTAENVLAAAKEIQTGERCSIEYVRLLNRISLLSSWQLDLPSVNLIDRGQLEHKTSPMPTKYGYSFDDTVGFKYVRNHMY